MKKMVLVFFVCILQLSIYGMTPQEAVQTLMDGNKRFSQDKSLHSDRTSERRQELASNQAPFATILGCSDSRVAPEIIFDQGIGDLFIVRVAGNVLGLLELDSIEYSVLYLKSSLIMVLGHEDCGAIKAVIGGTTKDIESVAELIQPAVQATQSDMKNRLENTIKTNVKMVSDQLKKSPALNKFISDKKLTVVGGYYNFHTGKVEMVK